MASCYLAKAIIVKTQLNDSMTGWRMANGGLAGMAICIKRRGGNSSGEMALSKAVNIMKAWRRRGCRLWPRLAG